MSAAHPNARLETFCDGVFAIALTLLIIDLRIGESLLTRHAAPAVALYSATGALMGVGWALFGWTALKPRALTRNERAAVLVRKGLKSAYFAIAFYGTCAIVAVWFPLVIAVVITLMWAYWVIFGLRSSGDSHSE